MNAIKNWVLTRGVLYVLSQAPIIAVLTGFFFKLLPFHYTNFVVLVAFLVLPAWVAYRKKVSVDPEEPVHHLHRYALYALMPLAAFSIARIPVMAIFNFPFWHPWYDFGHTLTGEPMNEFASLVPGAMLYTLQGYSLGLGFYILFSRHSFINSFLYLCVFLSSLYCYVFPEYGRVGMPTSALWHYVAWWAHFCMAVVAWYMPSFFAKFSSQFSVKAKALSVMAVIMCLSLPYGFAFWEAYSWQFPRQHAIDQEIFNRPELLTLLSSPKLKTIDSKEAIYEFVLRFGPRSYKTYTNKTREIDAKNININGEITSMGELLAWCAGFVAEVESANQDDQFAPDYFAKIRSLEYTDINVKCVGAAKPSSVELVNSKSLSLKWHASMMLVGDRESELKEFSGLSQPIFLSSSN